MALHEQSVGATSEWYTPPYVFEALGCRFNLDPACPPRPAASWVPADERLSVGGLERTWWGFVWMNPPFGARNGLVPWLQKFTEHGNGVALVPDRTSAPWWQTYAPRMGALLFVSPKIRFIGPDSQPGRSPAQGTTLMGLGTLGIDALERASVCGLGFLMKRP